MSASIKSKEYYSLMWEYLKRSYKYKIFCEAFSGLSPMALLGADELSTFAKKQKINPVVFINYYSAFGNIYTNDFNDWWEKNKQDLTSKKLMVSDLSADREFLTEFTTVILNNIYQFRNKTTFSADDVFKIRKSIINYLFADKKSIYLKLNISQKINLKKISSAIKEIVTTIPIPSNPNRLRSFELNHYLIVYDLKDRGLTYREIIEKIGSKEEKNNSKDRDLWTVYQRWVKNAKQIIENVENGKFPGEYSKLKY